MKLSPRKPSSKLAVRAATAITGVAALTVGYAQTAHANPVPGHPFKLWVYTGSSVAQVQVPGWKSVGGVGHWNNNSWQNNDSGTHNEAYSQDHLS